MSEEDYIATVAALQAESDLPPLSAGVFAALHLGISAESRGFARLFGIAHALTLRAVTDLAGRGFIEIVSRNPRTQRTSYAMSAAGESLCTRAGL